MQLKPGLRKSIAAYRLPADQSLAENSIQSTVNSGLSCCAKPFDVDKANIAGKSLSLITASVYTITDMKVQIAGAEEQQSVVAEEISHNMIAISEIAQETAHDAQQTASGSSDLTYLAENLQALVNQFRM